MYNIERPLVRYVFCRHLKGDNYNNTENNFRLGDVLARGFMSTRLEQAAQSIKMESLRNLPTILI